MAEKGLKVKHDTVPTAMELVQSSANLQDPKAYVTKASAQTGFVDRSLTNERCGDRLL